MSTRRNFVSGAGMAALVGAFEGSAENLPPTMTTGLGAPGARDEIYVGSNGLRGAVSPDGLSWRPARGIFEVRGLDTQNVAMYDPRLRRYVAYVRSNSLRYAGGPTGEHTVFSLAPRTSHRPHGIRRLP